MDSDREKDEGSRTMVGGMDAHDSERKTERPRLEWRDYLALTIAAFQSILLPLVILIAALLFLLLVLSIIR